MFSIPTDKLYKFAAIGGLTFAFAGGGAALMQYHETALQNAEFYAQVLTVNDAYGRFAELGRKRIEIIEKLNSSDLSRIERNKLIQESAILLEKLAPLDREVQDAIQHAEKQRAVTKHFYLMQAIWFILAGASLVVGGYLSWWGFKTWIALPPVDR